MKPGEDREATQQILKLLASPIDIFNYLCAHSDFDIEYKQELLEMDDIDERLRRLTVILSRDLAILN
jgi:Lon protease-like protein